MAPLLWKVRTLSWHWDLDPSPGRVFSSMSCVSIQASVVNKSTLQFYLSLPVNKVTAVRTITAWFKKKGQCSNPGKLQAVCTL